MKRIFFLLLLWFFSVIASGIILEFGLRQFYFKDWPESNIVGNPDHRMTKKIHNNINSDGIRSPVESDAYDKENFNVIFLGDSFVFGWRMLWGKTLPSQFEKQAKEAGYDNVRVANFGWVSSSPFLSNRLLRDIGQKYQPKLVVLVVDMSDIFEDHLYRNAVEHRRVFGVGQYFPAITQFISLINQSFWKSDWLAKYFYGVPSHHYFIVDQPLEKTRPYFDELMANVDAINAYCRDQLHVPFALFIMPRHFQFDPTESPDNWEKAQYPLHGPYVREPFRYFSEIAKEKPYPVIPLLNDFSKSSVHPLYFRDDPHLNEQGNAFAASRILLHLQQDNLLTGAAVK